MVHFFILFYYFYAHCESRIYISVTIIIFVVYIYIYIYIGEHFLGTLDRSREKTDVNETRSMKLEARRNYCNRLYSLQVGGWLILQTVVLRERERERERERREGRRGGRGQEGREIQIIKVLITGTPSRRRITLSLITGIESPSTRPI